MQRGICGRERKIVRGCADNLFLGNNRARVFEMSHHRPKNLRSGAGKLSLAQSLAQETSRQRFELVMRSNFFDSLARQALKAALADEDTICLKQLALNAR